MHPERLPVGVDPAAELGPRPDERLVRDLHGGLAGGVVSGDDHQPGGRHLLDHTVHPRSVGAGHELGQGCPAPRVLGSLPWLREAEQHPPRHLLAVGAEAGVDVVRAPRERPADAAAGGVGLEGQEAAAAAAPELEQQVLEEGQGPRLVRDVGEDAPHEPGLQLQPGRPSRLLDRIAQAVRAERPDEELVLRHQRAQRGVIRAAGVEVGPHRDDDGRAASRDRGRVHQAVDERPTLARAGDEREHLLELVDDDEQPLAGPVQRADVAAERGGVRRCGRAGGGELSGQRGKGSAAGGERDDPEGLVGGAQARHEAGPHERALAAARGAEHREEAGGAQLLDEERDLAVPAEEEIGVLLAEELEAQVRGGLPLTGGRPDHLGG